MPAPCWTLQSLPNCRLSSNENQPADGNSWGLTDRYLSLPFHLSQQHLWSVFNKCCSLQPGAISDTISMSSYVTHDTYHSPFLIFTNAFEWHVRVGVRAVLLSRFGKGTVTDNCMHRAHTINLQPQTRKSRSTVHMGSFLNYFPSPHVP